MAKAAFEKMASALMGKAVTEGRLELIAQSSFIFFPICRVKFRVWKQRKPEDMDKNLNKIFVKIIKRKDAEIMANAKTQSANEERCAAPVIDEKIERRSRRKIAKTISDWISERRETNRIEETAAIRRMFGNETLMTEI